ncbi:MAG: hypothetical protein ABEJ78_00640, partial [Haloferacaceae archaeon]
MMWVLSLVLAGVFVLVVYYGLSYADSGPSDRRLSMPVVALVAIFVLAAVGGVVALEVGDGPSLTFPSGGTPTATPQASTPTPAPTPAASPTATPQSTPTPTPAAASTTLVHVADADT